MSNETNPANPKDLPKGFRPMSSTQLRLEVPKREGYHRHWFRGTGERIARAQQAGYTFVDAADIKVNNFDLGGDAKTSGNSDMGTSRVSVVSGDDIDHNGQPGRLYLMECPQEFYAESERILARQNEDIAEALRGGKIGEGEGHDDSSKYVKGNVPDLFNPNKRRRT